MRHALLIVSIRNPMHLRVVVLLVATIVTGCASLVSPQPSTLGSHSGALFSDAAACRDGLASDAQGSSGELDLLDLKILNWNIKKGLQAGWQADLAELSRDKDLVLMQEAGLEEQLPEANQFMQHWSFAPGYRSGSQLTGVMTLSSIAPLIQCNLVSMEPWLNTPKATSITQYAVKDSDETLLVANIHAVNFTMGLKAFRSQIEAMQSILAMHSGPLILSGDFNTWSSKRLRLLTEVTAELAMQPIGFQDDQRTRTFNYAIDHIFVRGLNLVSASATAVQSSDHNPMTAEFSR
jgi:endonuclease/exonuclease/phosphatase (EEP) superfamily protein YafD